MKITQTEAARLIGRDARTVRRWVADGLLKTYGGGAVDKAAVLALARFRGGAGRKLQAPTAVWGDARSNHRWQKSLRRLKDCDDAYSILGGVVFANTEAEAVRIAAIRLLVHVLKTALPDGPQFGVAPHSFRPRMPVKKRLPDVCEPDDRSAELLALWFCCKHYAAGPAGAVGEFTPGHRPETVEAVLHGASGGILEPLPIESWLDQQLSALTAREILAVAARFVCEVVKKGPAPENWLFPTDSEKTRNFAARRAYYERRIGKRQRRETASKRGVTMAALLGCSRQMARYWRDATATHYKAIVKAIGHDLAGSEQQQSKSAQSLSDEVAGVFADAADKGRSKPRPRVGT